MCITSPELDAIQVRNYQKACGIAGFPAEKYMLMDYGESFITMHWARKEKPGTEVWPGMRLMEIKLRFVS